MPWKAQLEKGAADIFSPNGTTMTQPAIDLKALHAKIGKLTLENDLYKRSSFHEYSPPHLANRERLGRSSIGLVCGYTFFAQETALAGMSRFRHSAQRATMSLL